MKDYPANQIINLALIGHGSSGKTTLADAMLKVTGCTERIGKIDDGTTTMDFDPEEKKRRISISSAIYQAETPTKKLNIIDAPGLFDFAGGISEALTAADSALIVLSGKSGLSVGARLGYQSAKKAGVPCAFFIGKLDSSHAYFYRVISSLTARYGAAVCPVVVPCLEGEKVVSFVDLIDNKAYKFDGIKPAECPLPDNEEIASMRSVMLESVASVDEELMEKYFSGEEFTRDEIIGALKAGMASGDICPVFAGINQTGEGVSLLVDILSEIASTASDREYAVADDSGATLKCSDGSTVALVFKTISDPFVGKLSFFKVIRGKVTGDMKLTDSRTGNEERIGKIMWIKGGKQEDASVIGCGDIGSVSKLGNVRTGDTLCAAGDVISLKTVDFPLPVLSMAVRPKEKGDEEKIAQGLTRLKEEDPTISFYVNNETHEQIISGLGEQHLDVIVSKLKSKFGVDVVLKIPRVPYRETIRKSVKVQGRHKKQSGGHGQFGDVWIEFSPCEGDELVFEEKIFGGAVPKNYFPAVEKGLRESAVKGVLAGYPVVGLKATLVDGSYHPVDSSEMSFKMAANVAYKLGIPQAAPALLEPIGTLNVTVPDDMMGDVISDINKRRGRVLGMNPSGDHMQEITAEVPMSEMADFSVAMRSIAQGLATFTFEFERYEEAPPMIAQKVIESAAKEE